MPPIRRVLVLAVDGVQSLDVMGPIEAFCVEALRVERARALLEDGAQSLESVARAAGFSSPEILRRAFHRRLGVSPAGYRERFRLAA
jgi:transcriptional regulator GlxA family with amidase domain